MDYTIYTSDGSYFGILTCSQESLAPMIPEGGFYVEGHQHTLSTCVNGILSTPSDAEIETQTYDLYLEGFREERNKRLADTDWTQVSDSPLSDSKKTEWQTYRQALRDMPSQEGFDPLNPTYPTEPS